MIVGLAENLLWASVAMLIVLALRRPIATAFGAPVAYAFWLVPALRLIVPELGPVPTLSVPRR